MADRLRRCFPVLWLAVSSQAFAQDLPDPTRPPPLPTDTPLPGAPGAAPGVQMIIKRPGQKPAAVINGEYVELGARISGSRLVRIGDDSVVLEGPSGRETLTLTPGIAKKPATAGKRPSDGASDGQKGKSR